MSGKNLYFKDLRIVFCLLGLVVFVGSITSACTPAPLAISEAEAYLDLPAQFKKTPCRFPLIEQQAVECGDLFVPEDYSDPSGRQIRLHVAIIKSSSDTPAAEPLLVLLGGPGAHALDRLDKTMLPLAEVLTSRDVVLFDQRGVGYSDPSLNCPEINEFNLMVIDEQLNHEQEFERQLNLYQDCRARLETSGIDLKSYSAESITADVAQLRRAMGYDEWHLFGVSYGARLALIIMRDYPDGLRSVILDSVYPMNVDLAKETALTQAHALDMLFAETEASHPEFEQKFYDLVDELDSSPVAVPVADPRGGGRLFMSTFNGDDLLRLTINLVRWPDFIPHIPGMVDDITKGQYGDLSHFLQRPVGDQLFSEGMNLSVNCQEMDPHVKPSAGSGDNRANPHIDELTIHDVGQKLALCEVWLGEDWSPLGQSPLESDIPALILMGELDSKVPKTWSEQATAGLANRTMKNFPGTGHGVLFSNPCAGKLVADYLINPEIELDASCRQ